MKFSEQWLRGWVSPQVSRDELVARLSMAGLEVDSVDAGRRRFHRSRGGRGAEHRATP